MNSNEKQQVRHVIGNYSAAGCLKVALGLNRGELLVNEDLLTCGPAVYTEDLSVWRSRRKRFLKATYPDWIDFSFDETADTGLLLNASRLGEDKLVYV